MSGDVRVQARRAPIPGGPYLVLDADTCASVGRAPADVAVSAARAGVAVVQVRAKRAAVRELVDLTVAVAAALHPLTAPIGSRPGGIAPATGADRVVLVVDDRVDVALAARARGARVDGVHLGQRDLAASDARALLGPDAVIGVSAARPDELRAVASDVVDYVGTGPVRLTATKPEADVAVGFGGLVRAVSGTPLPVVAIGGLAAGDAAAVAATGAHGFAVVSVICAAVDVGAAARELADRWRAAQGAARTSDVPAGVGHATGTPAPGTGRGAEAGAA